MFQDFLHLTSAQLILIWSALALLVLLLCLRQPTSLVLSSDEKGKLQISRHALQRLIETCCEQLSGVASARSSVTRSRRGQFSVEIRLRIRPDAKLDAIQGYLTQEVGDLFRDNLGITDVGRIEFKVVGVAPAASGF